MLLFLSGQVVESMSINEIKQTDSKQLIKMFMKDQKLYQGIEIIMQATLGKGPKKRRRKKVWSLTKVGGGQPKPNSYCKF